MLMDNKAGVISASTSQPCAEPKSASPICMTLFQLYRLAVASCHDADMHVNEIYYLTT